MAVSFAHDDFHGHADFEILVVGAQPELGNVCHDRRLLIRVRHPPPAFEGQLHLLGLGGSEERSSRPTFARRFARSDPGHVGVESSLRHPPARRRKPAVARVDIRIRGKVANQPEQSREPRDAGICVARYNRFLRPLAASCSPSSFFASSMYVCRA